MRSWRGGEGANAGLAEYQQIRRWVRWPELEFPYTSTGKLMRRKVAEWVCGDECSRVPGCSILRKGKDRRRWVGMGWRRSCGRCAEGAGSRLTPRSTLARLALTMGHPMGCGWVEDLKLDSLGRVELQSALEERFEVELDEDADGGGGDGG